MVIGRIREHVGTHNWFAVGVDLAIVVVGVFLGLQANNWNAARIERAEAEGYRAQIIENLRANEVDIGARSTYYRQVLNHALAALEVLESPGAARDEAFLVHAYQASQVWQRPLARSAYDEMLEAALSGSVGGPDTRNRLTAYYAQMSAFNENALSVTAYRGALRRAMPYAVQRRIRSRCGDIVRRLPGGVVGASLPQTCSPGLDPESIARGATRVGQIREVDQELTRHIADLDQKLPAFEAYQRRARELREHLESLHRT